MKEKVIQFGEGGFLRGFADWMIQLANEKFSPFSARIKYIWIYNRDMDLIKEYSLK